MNASEGGIIEGESPGTGFPSGNRSRRPLLDLPQLFLPKIDLSPHTLSIAELAMLAFSGTQYTGMYNDTVVSGSVWRYVRPENASIASSAIERV